MADRAVREDSGLYFADGVALSGECASQRRTSVQSVEELRGDLSLKSWRAGVSRGDGCDLVDDRGRLSRIRWSDARSVCVVADAISIS